MGRGLSELQRDILDRASQHKRVYYADVLEGYFGWQPTRPIIRYGIPHVTRDGRSWVEQPRDPTDHGMVHGPGSHFFSLEEIGERRYRSTMVVLSRACTRLARRGLVTCIEGARSRWSGVTITDAGRAWLSANTVQRMGQCQPIEAVGAKG